MSKTNENILVPKFRFHEFANEKWDRKSIDETCEILNNLRKPLTSNLREKGEYPYYGASGIIDYVKDYIFNERLLLIGEDGAKWGAYEKTASIAEGKYWVNNHAHVLKPIGVVDTLLENYLVKLDISPFITGAAPPKLTLGKLKAIPVPIPENRNEQQKIASCLSSLDEVIKAESQKLGVLKEHKKGLLQNLFPQNGETVPKLRFKESEDSGEWAFDEFSEYIKLYRGSSPRPIQSFFTSEETGVNWIKIGDTKNADNFVLEQVEERITQEGAKKSRKVNVGELILANSMSFGKTYQLAIEGYIYDGWFVLRKYEKHFDKQFLLQLLNSDYMQNQYKKLSAGGIVQNISSDIVYKTILPHTSIKEQKKIANCLSSLDKHISAQSQKVEALKLHKKGLLQGLFPDVNTPNMG